MIEYDKLELYRLGCLFLPWSMLTMAFKDFLYGMGSVLSICPPERETKINIPYESDEEAIRKDWEAIGDDIRISAGKCDNGKE